MTTKFPCDYPIKIIGHASKGFDTRIAAIINKYQDKPFEGKLTPRESKEGNYLSFTVTVHAASQKQLIALFKALKEEKDVLMVI
ncbi:MAG: DUF493 domain-containing protein [Legionellales bacterium]